MAQIEKSLSLDILSTNNRVRFQRIRNTPGSMPASNFYVLRVSENEVGTEFRFERDELLSLSRLIVEITKG